MRIHSSNTLVDSNIFERASEGVHLEFDQSFLEGSLGIYNITISNNTFTSILGCTQANNCVTSKDPEIPNLILVRNTVNP